MCSRSHKQKRSAGSPNGNRYKAIAAATYVMLVSVCLAGCGNDLAQTAKPIVTSVIAEQLGGGAECVAVKLGKEFAKNRYHATAVLSNGNELKIVVYDQPDRVEVEIPTNQ